MGKLFNIIMRVVSTLIGLAMVWFGSVFVLQGLDIAFQGDSFMAGDWHWALYGSIIALLGLGQVIWSNTRRG